MREIGFPKCREPAQFCPDFVRRVEPPGRFKHINTPVFAQQRSPVDSPEEQTHPAHSPVPSRDGGRRVPVRSATLAYLIVLILIPINCPTDRPCIHPERDDCCAATSSNDQEFIKIA